MLFQILREHESLFAILAYELLFVIVFHVVPLKRELAREMLLAVLNVTLV